MVIVIRVGEFLFLFDDEGLVEVFFFWFEEKEYCGVGDLLMVGVVVGLVWGDMVCEVIIFGVVVGVVNVIWYGLGIGDLDVILCFWEGVVVCEFDDVGS